MKAMSVRDEIKSKIEKLVHDEMTQALAERLHVPLRVDMSVGPNWLDAVDVAV